MTNQRYEFHREETLATRDTWALVFDLTARAWAVEHIWRRVEGHDGGKVVAGKDRHSIKQFESNKTGRRLAEQLEAALHAKDGRTSA